MLNDIFPSRMECSPKCSLSEISHPTRYFSLKHTGDKVSNADDEPEVPNTGDNMAVSKELNDDEPEVPNTGENMAVSKDLNDDDPQVANTGENSGCLVENDDALCSTEVLVAADSENENQSLVSKEVNVDTHQSYEEFATKELAGKESTDVEIDLQEGVHLQLKVHETFSIVDAASASVDGRSAAAAKSASSDKAAAQIALHMAGERAPANAKLISDDYNCNFDGGCGENIGLGCCKLAP